MYQEIECAIGREGEREAISVPTTYLSGMRHFGSLLSDASAYLEWFGGPLREHTPKRGVSLEGKNRKRCA